MNVLNLFSLGCFLISNRNFDYVIVNPEVSEINSCQMVARRIKRNLDIFKRDYNLQQSNQIDYLECNYVSKKTNIKIYSNGCLLNGVLIDFDYDNGYVLVGDSNVIFDICVNGNSPFEGINADEYYYSIYSGYFYRYDEEYYYIVDNYYDERIMNVPMNSSYAGFTHYNTLYNYEAYILDRYGPSATLIDEKSIEMVHYDQSYLSCYLHKDTDDNIYSEGNCGLVAPFTVLQYLADNYWFDMPNHLEEELYDPYICENTTYNNLFEGATPKSPWVMKQECKYLEHWPKLYKTVRTYSINNLGTYFGLTVFQSCNILESVSRMYGHILSTNSQILYKLFINRAIEYLNEGKPLLFSLAFDQYYEDHTMVVNGYKRYEYMKQYSLFGFSFSLKKEIILFEICDGWHSSQWYNDDYILDEETNEAIMKPGFVDYNENDIWSLDNDYGEIFKMYYDVSASVSVGCLTFIDY